MADQHWTDRVTAWLNENNKSLMPKTPGSVTQEGRSEADVKHEISISPFPAKQEPSPPRVVSGNMNTTSPIRLGGYSGQDLAGRMFVCGYLEAMDEIQLIGAFEVSKHVVSMQNLSIHGTLKFGDYFRAYGTVYAYNCVTIVGPQTVIIFRSVYVYGNLTVHGRLEVYGCMHITGILKCRSLCVSGTVETYGPVSRCLIGEP